MFEQPFQPSTLVRRAIVSQSPSMIRQWIENSTSQAGGEPRWQVLTYPTRARALQNIDQWVGEAADKAPFYRIFLSAPTADSTSACPAQGVASFALVPCVVHSRPRNRPSAWGIIADPVVRQGDDPRRAEWAGRLDIEPERAKELRAVRGDAQVADPHGLHLARNDRILVAALV